MKNVVKLALVAGSVLCMVSSAFAGLTLCSKNGENIPDIAVKCGYDGKFINALPIKSNSCLPVSWMIVRGYLNKKTGAGECDFYISDAMVAQAYLTAQASSGTISKVTMLSPLYTTDPSTFPIAGSNLEVTIQKTS